MTGQSAQFAQLSVISELTHLHFQGGDVEEAHANILPVFLNCEHVARLISLVAWLESTLRHHIAHLPLHHFVGLKLAFVAALGSFFLQASLELARVFCLLNDSDFESRIHHLLKVFIEHLLREPNVQLLRAAHPVEVEQLLADDRVIVEDFVKFTEFEKEDFLEVFLLQLPILAHAGCEVFPELLRDEHSAIVVIRVVRPPPLFVLDVLGLKEFRQSVEDLLLVSETAADMLILRIEDLIVGLGLLGGLFRGLLHHGSGLSDLLTRGRLNKFRHDFLSLGMSSGLSQHFIISYIV